MRFLTRSLAGLLTLALTLGLLAAGGFTLFSAIEARRNADSPIRPARERVFAAPVLTLVPQTISPELTAYGSIRARRTLELRAATGGTVQEIAPEFTEGGQVRAGQVLLRLDPADAEAARETQAAALAEARAALDEATRAVSIGSDDLAAAERQMELREQALTRAQDKARRGVGTAAEVETNELAASAAEQAVLSRRSSLSSAQARKDQAAISVQRAQIALDQAERTLADTTITAGFDGQLAGISAVEGRRVSAGEKLGELIDSAALEVAFQTSTAEFARLTDDSGALMDLPATVALEMMGGEITAPARLARVSAAVSTGQTGRQVFAAIEGGAGLRPGDFVTIRVDEPALDRVALLPATAIGSDGTLLAVGADNRLEAVPAQLMRRQGDDILIRVTGALDGREVVAERSALLDAGLKIKPLRAGDTGISAAPETMEISDERRAKLIAAVETNTRMSPEMREKTLGQLREPLVPVSVVERIESRMGG